MCKLERVTTVETLRELYDGSALTFEGMEVDEQDVGLLFDMLEQAGAEPDRGLVVYVFSGKLMNDEFGLTGNNRYSDDLPFASVKLDQLGNVSAFAAWRIEFGGRWLDDIINNNLRREGKASWKDDYPECRRQV